jgi:exportin-T
MSQLLSHFEASELVDFMNFIGLLIFKLKVSSLFLCHFLPTHPFLQADMFSVLDELMGPLNIHLSTLFTQPISGTDDILTHSDTKKAYLALLNSIMSANLDGVFISQRECDPKEIGLT